MFLEIYVMNSKVFGLNGCKNLKKAFSFTLIFFKTNIWILSRQIAFVYIKMGERREKMKRKRRDDEERNENYCRDKKKDGERLNWRGYRSRQKTLKSVSFFNTLIRQIIFLKGY